MDYEAQTLGMTLNSQWTAAKGTKNKSGIIHRTSEYPTYKEKTTEIYFISLLNTSKIQNVTKSMITFQTQPKDIKDPSHLQNY
jgi:hypothetical protein